jgi:hypothetical protein
MAATFAALGFLLSGIGEDTVAFIGLASIVGALGIFFLLVGLFSTMRGPFSVQAAIGFDILATLGGALALGYLFAT